MIFNWARSKIKNIKNEQGFAGIAVLIVIVAVIIIGGVYFLTKQKAEGPVTPNLDAERPSEGLVNHASSSTDLNSGESFIDSTASVPDPLAGKVIISKVKFLSVDQISRTFDAKDNLGNGELFSLVVPTTAKIYALAGNPNNPEIPQSVGYLVSWIQKWATGDGSYLQPFGGFTVKGVTKGGTRTKPLFEATEIYWEIQ